jgi:N-acetylneuraminic acid mutarotase
MFNPRILCALALCSVGTLLAMLGFAGTPRAVNNSVTNLAAVPVSSGKVQLRPSAPIAEIQSFFSSHGASQTNGAAVENWQLAQRTEPIRRYSPHVVYDAARGQVVLFGGNICQGASCFEVNDTWTFDGTSWTEQHPTNSPPARILGSMVYDAAHSEAVLFGGATCVLTQCFAMGDTWTWDGTNWTERNPIHTPPARYSAAMSFDGNKVLLFGGCIESCPSVGAGDPAFGAFGTDTWTWDGSDWTLQTTASFPPPRAGASFAYDSGHGKAILFSGAAPQSNNELTPVPDYSDTWAWNGTSWTQLSPATSPPGRQGAGMVYDSARSQIVLFGGYDDEFLEFKDSFRQDTWLWDGTNWAQQSTTTMPWQTLSPGLAYDSKLGKAVLIGGFSFYMPPFLKSSGGGVLINEKDTWTLDQSGWTKLQTTWPTDRDGAPMAYDPNTGTVILTGGFCLDGPDQFQCLDTWSWDGAHWTELHPATPAPNTYVAAHLAFTRSAASWSFGLTRTPGLGTGRTGRRKIQRLRRLRLLAVGARLRRMRRDG